MYTGHSTAALALRAKCSFYYSHLPLSTDYYYGYGSPSCLRNCIPCSQSSLCAVPSSPRLIYYSYVLRRHSPSLFQLQPSRALLVPRRTVRVSDGGGFDEVIGLLAEPRRCCRCCGGEGFAPEDGDLDRYSRKEGAWGDGPRSRYGAVKSSSFSGEFEGRVRGRRRAVGESSRRGGKKGYGIGRVDVEEKVVREIRKREDDGDGDDDEKFSGESRNERGRKGFDRGIWEKEGNVASWRDSGRETREEDYAYEEPRVRNGRASSSRREVSELRSRIEDANIDDRMSSGRRMRKDYVREEQDGSQKLSGSSERNRYEFRHESNQNNMDRGESSASVVKQQSEVDKQVVGQADTGKSSLRASNVEKKSNSQRRFEEERMRDREERSTSVKNFFGVKGDERTQTDQKAVDKVEVNELYETRASDSRFRGSDTERAESSKSYLEIRRNDERKSSSLGRSEEERMKYREDKSTSVENLVRVRRDERTHVNQQAINKMESNEQYEIQINSSRIHCSSTERVSNAKSSLQTRADNQEEHSTSVVDLVHGVTDSSRVESEWDSFASEFRKSSMERVSNLQEVSTIRSENENESSSSVMVQDKKDDRQRSNLTGESLQSTKIQMGISESLHGSSSSVYRVKNDAIETASRYDESSAMYVGEFVNKLRQEALTSDGSEVNKDKTHREAYQETSTVELGVDDITRHRENYIEESGRQSSSRSGMKGPSDEMWEVRGMSSQEPSKIEEEPEKESPDAEVVDSNTSPGIAENAITRRSHRSLWTYIANIMNIGWAHRAGSHSSTKKSGTQSLSNESTGSEAWFSGHESDENDDETEKKERDVSSKESMPLKQPAVQSKVDVSASMDTTKRGKSSKSVPPVEEIEWSEGGRGRRESSKSVSPAEEIEWSKGGRGWRGTLSSNMTIDLSLVQKGNTTSSPLTETQKDQMHGSNSPKSEEDFGRQKQTEVIGTGGRYGELKKRNGSSKVSMPEESNLGPSTSVKTMRRASSSKGFNLVSGPEDFESTADDNGQRGILSDMDQSSILTAGMVPPSIPEIETIQMADRGMPKLEEVTNGEKLPEVGGTEGTEGELKRRKFQRNKQVMKEQFEEWEEAYKCESEQQKIDEFFMREALLEAKKAADTWEVPVGAVLVHKGKIIARGCNLVEELRDSTAHAEMICIREASNLLRTWRLAETTLYVTLEPCPMCAGAILQARIDTVVWGAPNKLLGADGSWVRLFPNRDGGGSSLDPANQTAGPVHPFHTKITIRRGILATECADAMQQFFQLRRKNKKQERQPSPPPSCLPISAQPTKLLRRMHDIFSVMFCL